MTTESALTVERLKVLLEYAPELGVFFWRRSLGNGVMSGDIAGQRNEHGRVYIGVDGRRYPASHLAWLSVYGVWPSMEIDHINGDPSDDRIANLRDVSHQINLQNRTRSNLRKTGRSSAFLGVSWKKDKSKWVANISTARRTKHLGYFDSEQSAHEAYVNAKRAQHEGNTL